MKVRAITSSNDWTFGKGLNNYRKDVNAVEQKIKTVLQSFLGDCFFDLGAGIDWFNELSVRSSLRIRLIVSTQLLNIPEVTGISYIDVQTDTTRKISLNYKVNTVYGIIDNEINIGV